MPFGSEFDDIYKIGIKETAEAAGVEAQRVDEQIYTESILERIYRQINVADFVIADMTGKNPNVFYEVGYAHALGKLCTLITRSVDDIPFDLRHHRHIVYNGKLTLLKQLLGVEIAFMKEQAAAAKQILIDAQLGKQYADLTKTDYSALAQLTLTIDIRNPGTKRSPEIEAIYLHTGPGWSYSQNGTPCRSETISTGKFKLRHFIQSPLTKLSPGSWAPIQLDGKKYVWWKSSGEAVLDKYPIRGLAVLEIVTTDGPIEFRMNIDTVAEEFPF